MNNRFLLSAALLLLFSLPVAAQTEATETGFDFRSRTSATIDWKVAKDLHVSGGYELRTAGNLSRIQRHQVGVGVSWAPVKHFDVGGGYKFLGQYDSDKNFEPRHFVYVDLGGGVKFGAWKLSLKERLQMTSKAYEFNRYQQTPNLLELKSRLKIAYKGLRHIGPYAYVELRNTFNSPYFTYDYDQTTGKYSNYQFIGYSDAYINRVRAAIGLEWKIDNHNALDFKLMNDWCSDKKIDTNAEGTKLKSYQWEKDIVLSLCVAYVFSIK